MSNNAAQKIEHQIPIGRRIGEIMEEKGAAFSIRAFSQRIGITKDTLARMITGERYINPTEMEKIAKGLSLSVERLKKEDTESDLHELQRLLDENSNPTRAVKIAQDILSSAIGMSERCDALNDLARAYFDLGEVELAHSRWTEAYELAQKIYSKYNDSSKLNILMSKLIISYTARKEFSSLTKVLEQIEGVFASNPAKLGSIYYSKAMIAENLGDRQRVKEYLYKSLEFLQMTEVQNQIGRAKLNVGFYEYKSKNYQIAKNLLEESIADLGKDKVRYIAIKEYVKCLLKVGDTTNAIEMIENSLEYVIDQPILNAKYKLLLCIAKNDPTLALRLVDDQKIGIKVQNLACKFLMKYYSQIGDSESLMKYYSKAEELSVNISDILHEEDL